MVVVQLLTPLQTPRLTLRAYHRDDLDALAAIYESPIVARFLYWEPRDREQTLVALEKILRRPSDVVVGDENVLPVAVIERDSGRLIGDFLLRWTKDEHQQGEIGGSLHPNFHGHGFATEVYRELLRVGFAEYQLHRIVGRCDGRNAASIRSLEKAGLHREAHLVENEFVKGEWTDEVVLAIRRTQWVNGEGRDHAPDGR